MALYAVWWGQEYTIPNRRQLNYALRLTELSDGYVIFEFHAKRG